MTARSWIEVSRSRIAANFRCVRKVVEPGAEVCPVVKADAYRHGAVAVSRILVDQGARWLAVSSTQEGIALRNAGIGARILVMADFLPATRAALLQHELTPVLHSLEDIAALDEMIPRPVSYHLKIDSGMGRLGTRAPATQILAAVRLAKRARLEGLMTHFAAAADYIAPQTNEQTQYFTTLCNQLAEGGLQPDYLHMASTIAIAYGRRDTWRHMVRPGHAIYGYVSPVRSRENPPANLLDVRPALAWHARLLAVKDVPSGARIGYGAMFRAPVPMRVGVVAAGYADGVPHRLGNRGRFIAAGQFSPILGAVSMDLTTIDLSHAPHLRPGDPVTLLGGEGAVSQDAQQMARLTGTISYSLLCGISARVERVYVD